MSISKDIEHLISEATLYLNEIKFILNRLTQVETDDDSHGDLSEEETILKIQLILQYRLSCDNALGFLLRMDNNLLYFLGIQPQQSAKMNLDRLAYAIGHEDLKQILNVLAILTGSLSKIASLYKSRQTSFSLKESSFRKKHYIIKELSTLLAKQNQFVNILEKLHLKIDQILKFQASGPIFDHIAALRGPISYFYQACINGLEQSKYLYQQANKTPLLNYKLDELLKETKQVLHSMPSLYNPTPNYSKKQLDPPMNSEQLEQRASAKRLRPFFG